MSRRRSGREIAFVVMWSYLISVWTALAILPIAAGEQSQPHRSGPRSADRRARRHRSLLAVADVAGQCVRGARRRRDAGRHHGPEGAAADRDPGDRRDLSWARNPAGGAVDRPPFRAARSPALRRSACFRCSAFECAAMSRPTRSGTRAAMFRSPPCSGRRSPGAIYVGVTWAVFYLAVRAPRLRDRRRPSPTRSQPFLGSFAGSAIAAFAAISALGCLNGWTLCRGRNPAQARARRRVPGVVRENDADPARRFARRSSPAS